MKFLPRVRSALGEIFNYMIEFILTEKGHILDNFDQLCLSRERIELYCESINQKGSVYERCFTFLDGTVRATCRPKYSQRQVYRTIEEIMQNFSFIICSSTMATKDCIQ